MALMAMKATLIWFAIALLAIGNGFFREAVLIPKLGIALALPASGVLLSVIVIVVALLSIRFIGARKPSACIQVGSQWVLMTLAFEFIFGHYVAGKSWSTLLRNFDVTTGDLFSMVLLVTLVSPLVAAKLRGHLH